MLWVFSFINVTIHILRNHKNTLKIYIIGKQMKNKSQFTHLLFRIDIYFKFICKFYMFLFGHLVLFHQSFQEKIENTQYKYNIYLETVKSIAFILIFVT